MKKQSMILQLILEEDFGFRYFFSLLLFVLIGY